MAFPTKDGQKKSSKFRANRADREHEKSEAPKMGGPRAQAHELEGKSQGNPEQEPMEQAPMEKPMMGEEQAEEQVHPGIHDEIKQVMAEHGPAHTVNMVHDHEAQKSHVHSIHADGHEHHADHEGPEHHMHAHHHAAHAAGVSMPGEEEKEGHYPEEHGSQGEEEESYAEPL